MSRVVLLWYVLGGILLLPGGGFGQIAMPANGSHTRNFNSLANTGTASWIDDVTLPGWFILCKSFEPCAVTGYAASTGSSSGVGVHSFGSSGSTDRALGNVASTGPINSTRFTYELLFTNSSSFIHTNITVSYVGEQWRKSGTTNRHTLLFYYRVGTGGKGNGVAVTNLDFTSPVNTTGAAALNGNSSANRRVFSNVLLPGAAVKPGETLFLMWVEAEDSGAGHGLAIDDVSVNWSSFGLTIQCPSDLVVTNFADVPPPNPGSVVVSYACSNAVVMHVGDVVVTNTCDETIYRTYQVTDNCNRTNTCTQTITISHPLPNDRCTGAVTLADGVSYPVDTTCASSTGDPLFCTIDAPALRGLWFKFTPQLTGMVTVNTSGDYINRTIMVYTNCAAASSVACDFRSVSFPGDAGTTYWILVGAIYETEFRGNVVATVCEMPHIQSTNSYALLESEGVRVYYSASATGAGSLNYNWSFFDANDGFMFSANGQTVSRLFGPFDSFPARFNVSVSNGCTNDGTGGTFPPPCGAICLSVGIPSTRTGTNGAGLNSYSLSSSCGTFAPGNSRWFLMSKLTNAAGMAFVSSEGSAADTMLGIFRGGINPATLFPLACSASSNNLPARVEFETRPGSNYWLAVITTNPAALKLTYGYDVKVASFTLDSSNRTVDLRSAPVPSLQYQLLCSTNLSSNPADWSVLLTTNFSTNISASNNVLRFLDTNISTNRQRFYRLSLLP